MTFDGVATKPRLLFVDDEQDVMDGLRDVLRPYRTMWDMEFVVSGKAAIERLTEGGVSVLCTDMRMPEATGGEVLAAARAVSPQTIRLVLTGQVGVEETVKALPDTHQFLAKPCSPEDLEHAVARAVGLSTQLADPDLRSMIGGLGHLPSPPATYMRLNALLSAENTTAADIAAVIEADVGLTIRVLQLVNSSFFRRGSAIETVERAVMALGFDLVRMLVLAQEIFAGSSGPASSGSVPEEVRTHGEYMGALLPKALRLVEIRTNAVLLGLLHDVGHLALAGASKDRRPAKRDHAVAGGFLLDLWGIDAELAGRVAGHHDIRELGTVSDDLTTVVLEVCDVLVHEDEFEPDLVAHVLDLSGLDNDVVAGIRSEIEDLHHEGNE